MLMTEAELQRLVTDLAELFGWSWVHFRPAQTNRGWRVPVEGPLGKGWPDLVLVHVVRQRLIFAELKRQTGQVDADQAAVLAALQVMAGGWMRVVDRTITATEERHDWTTSRIDVVVWRPSDLGDPIETGEIARVLRGAEL